MTEASIPVDLYNPGQVFACLGFLEAAEVLLGDAEGGFDWSDAAQVRFRLRVGDHGNPFGFVLGFLSGAKITAVHIGNAEQPKKGADGETFPSPEPDPMSLPIRLATGQGPCIEVGHWADGSGRETFKLYSGNRSAEGIARAMLRLVANLWKQSPQDLEAEPFGVLTPMGGSFNFDPRGAWTGIDAGYSLNDQKHEIMASPVVEILAALGLEHARPDEYGTRQVRYGVWSGLVPPMLARPALAGASVGLPIRKFLFELDLSGKNKVVTFAQEETST